MSLSSASILLLHALVLTTLLLLAAMVSTTTSVLVEEDVNTTMLQFTNNGSSAATSPDNFEMYYCFLCTGRQPLLIHHCPIYWDECHLMCWDWDATSSAAIPDEASSSSAPPTTTTVQGDDCYVMKLYMSGRYVIVERRSCDGTARCFLTCGGGELDDQKKAVVMAAGTATTAVPATTTTVAIQGRFLPCNTQLQVNAPPSSSGAIVVPAGGAR